MKRGGMRARVVMIALLLNAGTALAADWKPERPVEIVAMSGPGGANDVIARTLQRVMQQRKLVDAPMTVVSKVGAGGVIAWSYLNQHAGDGGYISVSPINLLIEHILGASPITYTDITPIAQLFNEYVAFAVKAESPLRGGRDVVDKLKADPVSVTFAVAASLGGSNHIATMVALKSAGVDVKKLKFVVFTSGVQSLTNVMGGHVDVAVVPVSGVVSHVTAGRLRVLAVSAAKRLGGSFSSVPTWKEQGADSVFSSARGVIGPKGMTAAQIAYWENVLARVVESDDWKKDLENNYWEGQFLTSADTRKLLKTQYDQYKSVLIDVGLAR
ncbi:MAG TPA: tripartite tricarboxylate transporter substrate binding protein [Burkholderiales bacterium]|nr:tripartite tricarboxylate transporter substrate binding protein [Burkholderiales bacterium]